MEKHKVPSCFWQIFDFWMFTIEMIDVLVVATSFLEITCVGQLDKSMRQLGIYPVAVAQPSPARKFDALLPLQSRILKPPTCSPARWYAAATLCLVWNVGWAFAEIPAFSIAFAELPRLFQLDQCWFDNPTLLKYFLPKHSKSHNRSHMNWDVWNAWNPICMMIRWLLTLWWSTGKCACSINRSITKQTQSKTSEQLTSLSLNQNDERKKDSLSCPPKNQHLTYI